MIIKPDEVARLNDPVFEAKKNQENNLISMVKGFSDEHLLFMAEQIEKETHRRIDKAQAVIDKLTGKSLLPK